MIAICQLMPIWDVWAEGYAATGEHGTATFLGQKQAATFEEACRLLHQELGEKKVGSYTPPTEGRPPMFWGCRLFDNEAQARESYG